MMMMGNNTKFSVVIAFIQRSSMSTPPFCGMEPRKNKKKKKKKRGAEAPLLNAHNRFLFNITYS